MGRREGEGVRGDGAGAGSEIGWPHCRGRTKEHAGALGEREVARALFLHGQAARAFFLHGQAARAPRGGKGGSKGGWSVEARRCAATFSSADAQKRVPPCGERTIAMWLGNFRETAEELRAG